MNIKHRGQLNFNYYLQISKSISLQILWNFSVCQHLCDWTIRRSISRILFASKSCIKVWKLGHERLFNFTDCSWASGVNEEKAQRKWSTAYTISKSGAIHPRADHPPVSVGRGMQLSENWLLSLWRRSWRQPDFSDVDDSLLFPLPRAFSSPVSTQS